MTPTELLVDLNEDGFTLFDVLAICSTGNSSKASDDESTGEKGFGFKAVFGVSDRVHILSGLWSFRFEHQRHQDGIGMVSPIWEEGGDLKSKGHTYFKLRLSKSEEHSLEKLCKSFESQHPSIVFGLRTLKKVTIKFQNVQGRDYEMSFSKMVDSSQNITKITSEIAGKTTQYVYRTHTREIGNMPKVDERKTTKSIVKIGLPVNAGDYNVPETSETGQYIFAFLPIVRMPQMRFLIHADFLLPGSRQAIIDNSWNRKLREGIVNLFANSIEQFVKKDNELSYGWHSYVPTQPMADFWQPFIGLIKEDLSTRKIYYSRAGTLHSSSAIRLLPSDFSHESEPLLSDSGRAWGFLSKKYRFPYWSTFEFLGVKNFSYDDAFDLIDDDIQSSQSWIQKKNQSDGWHDSFLKFIEQILNRNNASSKKRIFNKKILPVRIERALEWWCPGQDVYFPTVVEEGAGSEQVKLQIPTDIGFVVLHPDAAIHPTRQRVYRLLGVRDCSSSAICNAIEKTQSISKTRFRDDLLSHLELLFWFQHKITLGLQYSLVACSAANTLKKVTGLFLRSDRPYHAESLLHLQDNPQYKEFFMMGMYQNSPIAMRSRGGLTWEQWLCDIAGARWFPPLRDPETRDKLHWTIEKVRSENSHMFVPLIQQYWSQEYGEKCMFNSNIKQALMKCNVPCRNGDFEQLSKTWFPSPIVNQSAEYYGIEKKLSVLALPASTGEHLISQWSCLRDLNVRSSLDLSFYREALSLLSSAAEVPQIDVNKMGWLYKNMGDCTTLEDQAILKVCVSPLHVVKC